VFPSIMRFDSLMPSPIVHSRPSSNRLLFFELLWRRSQNLTKTYPKRLSNTCPSKNELILSNLQSPLYIVEENKQFSLEARVLLHLPCLMWPHGPLIFLTHLKITTILLKIKACATLNALIYSTLQNMEHLQAQCLAH
jgi:hypothetical protein